VATARYIHAAEADRADAIRELGNHTARTTAARRESR
jgi:hypothetical protein